MIRRAFTSIAASAIVLFALGAAAQSKIDPYLDAAIPDPSPKAISISVAPPGSSEDVEVFIKSTDTERTVEEIRAFQGTPRLVVGQIITASVPSEAISAIAESPEVIFIEAAKPVAASNDVAMPEIGATEVHSGSGLPAAFTGQGVVMGVIDTGVDYAHDDFLGEDGKPRVYAIWDQSRTNGPAPDEFSSSYGTECDYASIEDGSCSLTDFDGHGTHVSGIAAGRDDKYGGVAPDAKIVMVKYDAKMSLDSGYADAIFSTKICEAAYYVFAKARELGMPAVVNLSLGTHLGAHDGTSLFEECLGGLLEGGMAGRALVAAAGNEYSGEASYTGIHAGFDPAGKTKASNFVIRYVTSDRVYYIDFWGPEAGNLMVGLALHAGVPDSPPLERSTLARKGEKISGSFQGGKIQYMITATEGDSPLNGKQHMGIRIKLSSGIDPSDFSFDLVVAGSGRFDAWLFPDKPARTVQFTSVEGTVGSDWEYVPGDDEMSIAIPATSPDVIAVGGYASRTRWNAGSFAWVFNGQELGQILNFSSSGPTAGPEVTGQKPEVAAPGGMVASALSSAASVSSQVLMDDGQHYLQAGTSMAAPYVSGAIALMFEANPNFTQGDVRGFITSSAYSDTFTGAVPNDRWGFGKLDILRAMEIAVASPASGTFDASGAISAPAGQTTNKGGCELVAGASGEGMSFAPALAFLAAALAIAAVRRRIAP